MLRYSHLQLSSYTLMDVHWTAVKQPWVGEDDGFVKGHIIFWWERGNSIDGIYISHKHSKSHSLSILCPSNVMLTNCDNFKNRYCQYRVYWIWKVIGSFRALPTTCVSRYVSSFGNEFRSPRPKLTIRCENFLITKYSIRKFHPTA